MLNERTLVLERISLAQMIELMIEMFVNFARGAVLDQQAAEDAEATHPHYLATFIHPVSPSLFHSHHHM